MGSNQFRRGGTVSRRGDGPWRRRRCAAILGESLEDRKLLSVADPSGAAILSSIREGRPEADKGPGRIDPALLGLYRGEVGRVVAPAEAIATNSPLDFTRDEFGRVGVTVTSWDVGRLLPELNGLGFQATFAAAELHTIEGFLPVGSLLAAAELDDEGLLGILPIYRPGTAAGVVNSQADFVLEADRVRNTPVSGVDGAGQRVGILSDSFNRMGGYAADVASGDLPNDVQVVLEGPAGSSDEGRGMAQLVHDLAPGAGLAFASAFYGEGQFGQSIRDLADPAIGNAGIITDDIFYFEEPQFQDGLIAQAINDVAANRDVAYFSLAGNLGDNAYESTNINFAPDPVFAGSFYDFNPGAGVDTRQRLTVAPGQVIFINLQWDDPFFTASGVDTDLDIFLLIGNTVVAGSDRFNIAMQTPSELFGYQNTTGASQAVDLVILNFQGPNPGRIKWVNYGANNFGPVTVNEFATGSPTVIPHSAADGGVSVGAAPFFDHLNPEAFTSIGPSTLLFAPDGSRLPAAVVRQAPDITAIDGTDTTFFGFDFDGNGRPNFFGTSASAPHAAAVAALIRQADPSLTSAQVYDRLASTATDIVNVGLGAGVGLDNRTGVGLINAFDAIFGPAVTASTPARDGFESGALSINWETFTNGAARTLVTPANGPATGSFHLTMDSSLPNQFGLNEATLRVDPAGASGDVLLAFRQREFADEDHPMPASFVGRGNFDGVALSVDGINWFRLVSLTGANSGNGYRNFAFNLSEFAADNGLTLGPDTRIRFQHYDNFDIPSDGFAFDDVRVAATTPISGVTIDDGAAHRSVVRQIAIDFDGLIGSAPGTAFAVVRAQDGATFAATPSAPIPVGPNRSRIRLTFSGPGTEFGSLPDGDYTLSIDGALILDDLEVSVDADANGRPGGQRSDAFFRLFGDTDGDRDVDGIDFGVFRQAYLDLIPLPSFLDHDDDGTIVNDSDDRDAFLARRGKRLTTAGVVFPS